MSASSAMAASSAAAPPPSCAAPLPAPTSSTLISAVPPSSPPDLGRTTMKLVGREVTAGLGFPEGPIALPDGSVIVVEIEGGRLTKVLASGKRETIAALGGGPNGAALGPDGKCYVCNNGGFDWL